ncbi:hypothetical protein Pres01_01310 [Metapseudomonas resinovorans]|nr:hypothetical protein Pres01_01310 [Pseudomonas resinovorans]
MWNKAGSDNKGTGAPARVRQSYRNAPGRANNTRRSYWHFECLQGMLAAPRARLRGTPRHLPIEQ